MSTNPTRWSTHLLCMIGLALTSLAEPRPTELESAGLLTLVDLSESGNALAFSHESVGRMGSATNPTTIRLGPSGDWDLLDFEVRGAAPGEELHFRLLSPPSGISPTTSRGEFRWRPIEDMRLQGSELRFEVTPTRSRFLVRLRPREATERRAPYYEWERFVKYMERIQPTPLAEVSQVGTSIQGRPLYRILVDDPTLPTPKKTVVMVVRQHGDEYGSSYLLEGFLDLLLDRGPGGSPERIVSSGARARHLRRVRWIIYPFMNPDGASMGQRYNANGVDLNRDWARGGCNAGQEPETFAIQCDMEALDAIYPIDIGGDHHGWSFGNHGGFRYAPMTLPSNLTTPEYREAKKDTVVIRRHDPSQENWQENGGTVGMLRVEMFLLSNFLLHTPEYDSVISSPGHFMAKGRAWGEAMVDTLFAPRFTDNMGAGLRAARVGSGIHVTADDDDENNVTAGLTDTVEVTVFDPLGGDIEVLTLVETTRGGLFRSAAPLLLSAAPAVPGNGILETSSGASIRVRYTDDDYPRDESFDELRIR